MGLVDRIVGSIYGRARKSYYQHRYSVYRKKYDLDQKFEFAGTDIRLYGGGKIQIGATSYIGTNSTIQAKEGNQVIIGAGCQISHNVRIYTSSADPDQDFTNAELKPPIVGDVIIGTGVWIGANVFINPGIKIGNNSVIGANSVVTRDVAENCIAAGVPCKLIKKKS